ncbi:hypothetical protein COU80_02980 [Candidatus Peregrinibacteria bacterium CG10_big_fil_rev_8_21_14_0_10_55_24]|nr:MAG: hypothetical protein COU80_02980 [Candidatus Peregrinibacteria bacterium CG10_big_fil_rev_8_21_14_0_10_55_24]
MRKLLLLLWHAPRRGIALGITLYQRTLSPDHGPLASLWPSGYCRHSPTCSAYAKEMIEKRGVLLGSLLAFKRILTCTPWHKPSTKKILETSLGASQKD